MCTRKWVISTQDQLTSSNYQHHWCNWYSTGRCISRQTLRVSRRTSILIFKVVLHENSVWRNGCVSAAEKNAEPHKLECKNSSCCLQLQNGWALGIWTEAIPLHVRAPTVREARYSIKSFKKTWNCQLSTASNETSLQSWSVKCHVFDYVLF